MLVNDHFLANMTQAASSVRELKRDAKATHTHSEYHKTKHSTTTVNVSDGKRPPQALIEQNTSTGEEEEMIGRAACRGSYYH